MPITGWDKKYATFCSTRYHNVSLLSAAEVELIPHATNQPPVVYKIIMFLSLFLLQNYRIDGDRQLEMSPESAPIKEDVLLKDCGK
jgi:hypothetical protein